MRLASQEYTVTSRPVCRTAWAEEENRRVSHRRRPARCRCGRGAAGTARPRSEQRAAGRRASCRIAQRVRKRPDKTVKPSPGAFAASSVTRRVLPTPASPLISITTGWPAAASASSPVSRSSSADLPTRGPRAVSSTSSLSKGRECDHAISKRFAAGDRLSGLDPEHRLGGLDPVDRVSRLDPVDRICWLDLVDRLGRLGGFGALNRLSGQLRLDTVGIFPLVDPGVASPREPSRSMMSAVASTTEVPTAAPPTVSVK